MGLSLGLRGHSWHWAAGLPAPTVQQAVPLQSSVWVGFCWKMYQEAGESFRKVKNPLESFS